MRFTAGRYGIALALAALACTAGAARAQHENASDAVWRFKVLNKERRLVGHPESDYIGTAGPRFVFRDGRWFSGDLKLVYREGLWITLAEDAALDAELARQKAAAVQAVRLKPEGD